MRRLIVTADDFGADIAVNEAVETGHREGVLTAASLMVGAAGAADAVRRTRTMPALRVGLHLVLVDGRPTLPPSEVPDLVDEAGRFRAGMMAAGVSMALRPAVRRQVAAEITAQFEAFRATGLALDHVNAHKHFHLHPVIAALICGIGQRHGLRAVRVPAEPRAVLAAVEPGGAYRLDPVVSLMAELLRRRLRQAGIAAADQVFGLRWSGAMTKERLAGVIAHLPPGLSEIYLHPAIHGGFEGAAPGYRYADELAALTAPEVVHAASGPHIRRGGYVDFAPAPRRDRYV
ncbi:MAG TPA: hopanoid biosynthesis-associated protein HpnK [Caulobacteraceae bacterium]